MYFAEIKMMNVKVCGSFVLVPCEFHIQCMPMKIGVKQAQQEV